jgi:AcrR family transcriptional regulator
MTAKIPTIDKIITASIDLFYKNSYASTTLQDISKASGAAIGSIYHAFPNGKPDIAIAINTKYQTQSNKAFGDVLKVNAINTTIEQIIDSLISTDLELGQKYPCYYDQTFVHTLYSNLEKLENNDKENNQLLEYIVILFRLKYPALTQEEAEIKAMICDNIWGSLLLKYYQTKDSQILVQLKIVILKYLQD